MTGETVTVVLRGEFDLTNENALAARLEQLREQRPSRLIFVMAEVGFIDCSAARLVAGTFRWLPAGVRPVISRPSPVVRRVLTASGIGALCEFD